MDIPAILRSAEPLPYGHRQLKINSEGCDIIVISDLHLAAGLQADGNYDGTENFFADQSFVRFLHYLQESSSGKSCILLINGDFIDFLRIRDIPVTEADFTAWENILADIGIPKPVSELRSSVVKKELEYGLKTDDFKSVWKLYVCAKGHQGLFEQLAVWLQNGNKLIITKGNHDLEWYWLAVRNYLRLLLAASIVQQKGGSVEDTLSRVVIPQVTFADDSVLIDEKVYVEHGHRYQKVTAVDGDPVLKDTTELNLPFGSFFNRYLLNRLELAYPYLDNIRPSENVLPVLIRERFPLAVKVLFKYIPFMLLIIPKKLYWEMFKRLFSFVFIIIIPVAITAYAIWKSLHVKVHLDNSSFITGAILSVLKNSGFLFLSYIFGRILEMVKLTGPNSLSGNAKDIFKAYPGVQLVTFGHTHDPEQQHDNGRMYFNTGTWIPVYETSIADVRPDKTYTYLHICQDGDGNIIPQDLLRWNDDALRAEQLMLRDRK